MKREESASLIGQSKARREDEALLRGEGRFIDDVPVPRGTLHVAFVLSPHAHARIVSIDCDEARALPGVVAVYTAADFKDLVKPIHIDVSMAGYYAPDRTVLASKVVRFVGESVAVVVATSEYIAQDAIDLVQVDYEALPAIVDMNEAMLPGAPLVHDDVPTNIFFSGQFSTPDFDQAFASGDCKLKETFRHGRVAGVPMEPRGCLAIPDGADAMVFHTSTQIHHLVREALASHLGRTESCIRVVVPDVGGGFGTKAQVYPEEFVVAALCFKLRKPVKWIQSRREELLTNIHARDHQYELEASVSKEGIVLALRLRLLANAGAYSTYPWTSTLECTGGARMLLGPYKIRNYAFRNFAVATHTGPSGVYRGVAQPSAMMALEGMMDRIARELGMDPAEVRRRNLVQPEDLPWTTAVGVPYVTGSFAKCHELALARAGYGSFRKTQPADRLVDGKYRGIGICNMTELTGGGAMAWRARGLARVSGLDSAMLRVEPSGSVSVFVSHAAAGQGHHTTFAQIAAQYLGANYADVRVLQGDTSLSPYGTNTFASRSAITGGGAVISAALTVGAKMCRLAATMLGCTPDQVELRHGIASSTSGSSVTFRQIAEVAYSMSSTPLPPGETHGLETSAFYDPPVIIVANATHVVQVAVDALDGRVTIERHVIAHDCGTTINPMVVEGQLHGGSAQGIGEALMEELVYDEHGQLVNATLLDYLLPTAMDIPRFEIEHLESPSEGLGGFKGVGEGGVIGAVPALVNAVADALSGIGANVNRTPMRPSYLRGLIRAATCPPEATAQPVARSPAEIA